jgi:hypothetical protein
MKLPMIIGQQPVAQILHYLALQPETLPESLRDKLPSIEAIERELGLLTPPAQ